jgi:ferric-dicitrate binding protein FerR (iron transport regulator)
MKLDVTRDVVNDLWPLYRSGEASTDTRSLVDAYLAEDGAWASTLQETENLAGSLRPPRLAPDAELRLLEQAQQRARTKLLIIAGAIGLGGLILLLALGGALLLVFRGL